MLKKIVLTCLLTTVAVGAAGCVDTSPTGAVSMGDIEQEIPPEVDDEEAYDEYLEDELLEEPYDDDDFDPEEYYEQLAEEDEQNFKNYLNEHGIEYYEDENGDIWTYTTPEEDAQIDKDTKEFGYCPD